MSLRSFCRGQAEFCEYVHFNYSFVRLRCKFWRCKRKILQNVCKNVSVCIWISYYYCCCYNTASTPVPPSASPPLTIQPPPFVSAPPSISLTVDAIIYQSNQVVVIEEGRHTFQCMAKNVPTGTDFTWDFGGTNVEAIRWGTTRTGVSGGLEDITSTVYVGSITSGSEPNNNTVSCSVIEPTLVVKHKRQTSVDLFVQLIIETGSK